MRPAIRRSLYLGIGLLIAAMIGCLAVAGWLERRQEALSGVPGGHCAVSENGRTFYVHRGGPPVDQRQQFPLSAEQHRVLGGVPALEQPVGQRRRVVLLRGGRDRGLGADRRAESSERRPAARRT